VKTSTDRLLTPKEVGDLFGVGPKTVAKWARAQRLPSFVTPGGHHRFREAEVLALLATEVRALLEQEGPRR
jgi:excisionase family DNA binding protein